MSLHAPPRRPCNGFTLIEVLVALAVMALLALLSWRSIDGMSRTQSLTRERADHVLRLQGAIGQWVADLDAVIDTQELGPLEFDGAGLRLTRRDATEAGLHSPGVRVVAWAVRNRQWMRWQSPALQQRDELASAWQRAAAWTQGMDPETPSRDSGDSAIAVAAIEQWQIYYHRSETWSHPLSSAGQEAGGSTAVQLPNGVRLVLTMSPGQPVAGRLTRDWFRPALGASP
ncbi:MAG: prepilin-type N-terminal cleavage/methylation domain-containing protein [Hydrogenophaga sp.]